MLGSEDLLIRQKFYTKLFIDELELTIWLINIYNEGQAASYLT